MTNERPARGGRKIRVGILFGGQSSEHAVSLASAQSVIAALDPAVYEVVPIGITRQGQWLTGGDPMRDLLAAGGQLTEKPPETDIASNALIAARETGLTAGPEGASRELHRLDVIFPVLHGPFGEDGTVQGFLELADIAYVGSGVRGSAVGMDKAMMKALFRDAGLPTPRAHLVRESDWERAPGAVIVRLVATVGLPCFIKPANMGSSVGVSKAETEDAIHAALVEAFRFDVDGRVLVEEAIQGREVECSVLGNEEPLASAVGEILVQGHEFYDYAAKYTDPTTRLRIPADLPAQIADEIRRLAVEAFHAIDAAGLARVDFFYDETQGRVLINEINTMPGFTATSMYAMMWQAVGVSYSELVDRLIALAIARHDRRRRRRGEA
ncbi:MAG TPA: D-alanine--D-alanine ligase family protein [Thermomicrobiales bacterium]